MIILLSNEPITHAVQSNIIEYEYEYKRKALKLNERFLISGKCECRVGGGGGGGGEASMLTNTVCRYKCIFR